MGIYEKMEDSDQCELVLHKMSSPKIKTPHYRGITNPAHSSHFIEAAYKGYCGREEELKRLYDFEFALEWYLESNLATVGESKFICATTCLEMLMGKFHSQAETEFLLEEEMFHEFYNAIKNYASSWLKARNVPKKTRAAIYHAMPGLNRRQYVDKAKALLDHLGVKYSDVGVTLEEIVKVRDQIIHRGRCYGETEKGFRKLFDAYEALFCILTRAFLAMLKYDEEYYDPTQQKWIKFAEVCSKI